MTTPQPKWLEELAKLYWEHKEKGVSEEYDAIKALFLKVEVEAYKKGYIDGGVKGYAKQHQKSAIIEEAFIADSFVEARRDLLLSGLCSDVTPKMHEWFEIRKIENIRYCENNKECPATVIELNIIKLHKHCKYGVKVGCILCLEVRIKWEDGEIEILNQEKL